MNQDEFREVFKDNHRKIVNRLCSFFEVDVEQINHMLKRSYIALAGGYARRLYMVSNKIDMTTEDMLEYFNSDIDLFVFSANIEERNKVTPTINDPFEVVVNAAISFQRVNASDIGGYKVNVYTGNKKSNSIELRFKPLGKLLRKSEHINPLDRKKMFYKDSLIMTTCFSGVNLFNIKDVSDLGKDMPEIQFIKASKSKLKHIESKGNKSYPESYRYAQVLLDTFDLSQTKFYIKTLDRDLENTTVAAYGANTQNVYDCDISKVVMNNVNMFARIRKYASIGMRFDPDHITNLLKPSEKRKMSTSIVEGGYY